MTIRDELLDLAEPDGTIHAGKALSWAADNPVSELHGEIEWDDAKAAHQHRLSQVRRLIVIHVVFADTGRRATVSLAPDRPRGGGYRPLPSVLSNQEMRSMLVRQILDEVARVLNRYPQLGEISPLQQAVELTRLQLEESESEQPLAAD